MRAQRTVTFKIPNCNVCVHSLCAVNGNFSWTQKWSGVCVCVSPCGSNLLNEKKKKRRRNNGTFRIFQIDLLWIFVSIAEESVRKWNYAFVMVNIHFYLRFMAIEVCASTDRNAARRKWVLPTRLFLSKCAQQQICSLFILVQSKNIWYN